MKHKHCIVTPDFLGPVNNGGIGTATFHLMDFLRVKTNNQVDVLHTGWILIKTAEYWKDYYREKFGVSLFFEDDLPASPWSPILDPYWHVIRSQRIHEWLKDRSYTHIHFQDYHANGYIAIQAKRCGRAYHNSMLTVTLHSSHKWMMNGNNMMPIKPIEESIQNYMESYCACNADLTISPSHYMLRELENDNCKIRNPVVIQNLYFPPEAQTPSLSKIQNLIFFGRLETRKGLEIFIGAIIALKETLSDGMMPNVFFLGRLGNISSGGDVLEYLRNSLESENISYKIYSDFSCSEAMTFIKSIPNSLCILPSLSDNLPYTIVECLSEGIPFISSNVGGIPELVLSSEHLFEPTTKGLSCSLKEVFKQGLPSVKSGYNLENAKESFDKFFNLDCRIELVNENIRPEQLTICIAYYNYGQYLPSLIDSLKKQTWQGFNLVVINDGSTDSKSNDNFDQMRCIYGSTKWQFLNQDNSGIGATRNRAADCSVTPYICFMDADNLAVPNMVEVFLKSLNHRNVDCLTCYARMFNDKIGPNDWIHSYTPVGPVISAGLYLNVYGDANFIIKKNIFTDLGGFTSNRSASFEDWDFLANLNISGYSQDVIPEVLFLYRITEGGFSRTTSVYKNFQRIIDRYTSKLPACYNDIFKLSYNLVRSNLGFSDFQLVAKKSSLDKEDILSYIREEHAVKLANLKELIS